MQLGPPEKVAEIDSIASVWDQASRIPRSLKEEKEEKGEKEEKEEKEDEEGQGEDLHSKCARVFG